MRKRLAGWVFLAGALCGQQPAPTETQCNEMLEHALSARNPDTRKQAVIALSLASDRGPLLAMLLGMTDDKDVPVRVAVMTSLGDVKSKSAIQALRKAVADPVPEVSFAAAKMLWNLHDEEGKQALLAVVEGESKTSSGYITSEMRQALRMMHTPTTTFLYAVREGMGFVPVPGLGQGIASMQAILTDPGTSGRATAVLLLGKDNDKALIPSLRDALHDKNWTVRAAAVHSFALRNDPSLREDLVPLLDDEKEAVRLRAAAGYLRLTAIQTDRLKRGGRK